jgi:hypothetical protein
LPQKIAEFTGTFADSRIESFGNEVSKEGGDINKRGFAALIGTHENLKRSEANGKIPKTSIAERFDSMNHCGGQTIELTWTPTL